MATAAMAAPSRQPRYDCKVKVRAVEITPDMVVESLKRMSQRQIDRLVELLPEQTIALLCSSGESR